MNGEGVREEGHGFGDEQAQDGFARTNLGWNELGMDSSGRTRDGFVGMD